VKTFSDFHLFPFSGFQLRFIAFTYFAHIADSNTVIDDVTISSRIEYLVPTDNILVFLTGQTILLVQSGPGLVQAICLPRGPAYSLDGRILRPGTPENFLSCPFTFLALPVHLVVLVSAFVEVSTFWSVSCLPHGSPVPSHLLKWEHVPPFPRGSSATGAYLALFARWGELLVGERFSFSFRILQRCFASKELLISQPACG